MMPRLVLGWQLTRRG